MKVKLMKQDEVIVKKDDFGFLVEQFVRDCLRPNTNFNLEWFNDKLRGWWFSLEEYHQRHIICDIEVAIAMDEPPRYNRQPMDPVNKFMWQKVIKDLRPARSTYTVDYHCHKCKARDLKLWRGVHGCADKDGNELLCAKCLAPDAEVDAQGRWQEPPFKDKDGKELCSGMRTDQVKSWLPAVPVGDTHWGYSSVPSQDVEWWRALPTYKKD